MSADGVATDPAGRAPSLLGHDAVRVTPGGKLGQIVTFALSTVEP